MAAYWQNAVYFIGVILFLVLLLVWYVLHKTHYNLAAFKTYWSMGGAGAIPSLLKAILLILAVTLVAFFANKVMAEDQPPDWFQYTAIYAGLDYTNRQSPQCEENLLDDHVTSNLGVRQHVYSWGDVNLLANYTHHSCAIGKDRNTYDAFGVQVEWRFNRY